jgi:hypothetical protein
VTSTEKRHADGFSHGTPFALTKYEGEKMNCLIGIRPVFLGKAHCRSFPRVSASLADILESVKIIGRLHWLIKLKGPLS